MDNLFELYKRMLKIHIATKTTDKVFHEATADFYSTLFDAFHQISEKNQDLEIDESECKCDVAEEAYDILEEAMATLEDMIEENKDK
jgi:hypothetical protein